MRPRITKTIMTNIRMIQKMKSAFHQRYLMPMMINDMNMKKFLFIVALIALQINVHAVTVKATDNLNVYYPEYTKIDLVCGQMPKTSQRDVDFCCEAAFTGELLRGFCEVSEGLQSEACPISGYG